MRVQTKCGFSRNVAPFCDQPPNLKVGSLRGKPKIPIKYHIKSYIYVGGDGPVAEPSLASALCQIFPNHSTRGVSWVMSFPSIRLGVANRDQDAFALPLAYDQTICLLELAQWHSMAGSVHRSFPTRATRANGAAPGCFFPAESPSMSLRRGSGCGLRHAGHKSSSTGSRRGTGRPEGHGAGGCRQVTQR
jgi:hypothetical protein